MIQFLFYQKNTEFIKKKKNGTLSLAGTNNNSPNISSINIIIDISSIPCHVLRRILTTDIVDQEYRRKKFYVA